MSYTDLEAFKRYVNVNRPPDAEDEELLQAAVDAAETLVNSFTGRTIELNDPTDPATARTFAATRSVYLPVDDFVELVSITDTALVDPTTYQIEGLNGQPYTKILRVGGWASTYGLRTVSVTAKWGWETIPAAIRQAAMILAKDILRNRDLSFGIAGFTEYTGVLARPNPQVQMLLAPFDRSVFIA